MLSVAVDIGTAVVSFALFDGLRRIARADLRNPQRPVAPDAPARLALASEGRGGELRELLSSALSRRVASAAHANHRHFSGISLWCFAGNPAMESIAAGADVAPLLETPPRVPWCGILHKSANAIGFDSAPASRAAFMPPLTPSCGGDAACALLSITEERRVLPPFLMVDMGMSADIAYCAEDGAIWLASVPSGPVFEAAGIGCGTTGFRGAIDHAAATTSGALKCHIVGDPPQAWAVPWDGKWVNNRNKARGICASGLLDAVAESVAAGRLAVDGSIAGGGAIALCDGLELAQDDIAAYLAAKAAVCAAIETVLDAAGARGAFSRIPFVASGSIGRHLSQDRAESIGLWPRGANIQPVGNAALAGVSLYLRAPADAEARFADMAARVRPVDLETPAFRELAARRRVFAPV